MRPCFIRKRGSAGRRVYELLFLSFVLACFLCVLSCLQKSSAFPCLEKGSVKSLHALLNDTPALIHERTDGGMTPLISAAVIGRSKMVECLLSHGAPINAADLNGETALSYAIMTGRSDIVKILLGAGASPNQTNHEGRAPLHLAVNIGFDIRELLHYGANPNQTTPSGETPFHSAARANNTKAVKALILAGADPVKPTFQGWTPLHVAALNGSAEVVALLVKAGADDGENSLEQLKSNTLARIGK